MSLRVVVPSSLRDLTGGVAAVDVDVDGGGGVRTVSDALSALRERHPALYERIVTERGEVRPHVNLFVGREDVRWTGGLETPIEGAGELVVLPSVSGG